MPGTYRYTGSIPHLPARTARGYPSGVLQSLSLSHLANVLPKEYFPAEMTTSILRPFRETVGALREMGTIIVPVDMPSTGYALSAYYVLASAEASSCLARFDGIQYGVS